MLFKHALPRDFSRFILGYTDVLPPSKTHTHAMIILTV